MSRALLNFTALLAVAVATTVGRTAVHAGSTPRSRLLAALPRSSTGLPVVQASRRQAGSAHQVQRLAHGLRLRFTVTRLSYPADALIPVTLTVENVSRRRISLVAGGPQQPGKTFPQVEVLRPTGIVLPPTPLQGYLPPPGPPPSVENVAPGRSIASIADVILSGPRVRATVDLVPRGRDWGAAMQIVTPALTIHLLPADPPHMMLDAGTHRHAGPHAHDRRCDHRRARTNAHADSSTRCACRLTVTTSSSVNRGPAISRWIPQRSASATSRQLSARLPQG